MVGLLTSLWRDYCASNRYCLCARVNTGNEHGAHVLISIVAFYDYPVQDYKSLNTSPVSLEYQRLGG